MICLHSVPARSLLTQILCINTLLYPWYAVVSGGISDTCSITRRLTHKRSHMHTLTLFSLSHFILKFAFTLWMQIQLTLNPLSRAHIKDTKVKNGLRLSSLILKYSMVKAGMREVKRGYLVSRFRLLWYCIMEGRGFEWPQIRNIWGWRLKIVAFTRSGDHAHLWNRRGASVIVPHLI